MQAAASTTTTTDTAAPATKTVLLDDGELSVWPGSVDTPGPSAPCCAHSLSCNGHGVTT